DVAGHRQPGGQGRRRHAAGTPRRAGVHAGRAGLEGQAARPALPRPGVCIKDHGIEGAVKRYVILTNRKRAIIALVHTVVFWLLALTGFVTVVRPVEAASPVS